MKTPSEMSLSELREAVKRGVRRVSNSHKYSDGLPILQYESIAQEYARRTADCVSVDEVINKVSAWYLNAPATMLQQDWRHLIRELQSIKGAKP